jgi:hypothetical protein
MNGGDYPLSHSSRPNLSFKPLHDRDEVALPPTAKGGVLGSIHVKFECADRAQGSVPRDQPRQGGDRDWATGGVSCLGLRQEFRDESSRKAVVVKASAWSSDHLWAVAKATRKMVVTVRYLRLT